jgi:hypothetical protein
MEGRGMSAGTLPAQQEPRAYPTGDGARQRLTLAAHAEDSRARDVEELCEQFLLVCESAVDPLEISSALEFEGLNDQAVRKRYGVSDVFALAEEMYRRVPRRPAEPEPLPDPWQASKIRPTLHGLLYGLPTVCFPAAAGLLAGPNVLSVLIVALLTSWATSQALAYLGYVRLGQANAAEAARLLLVGMAAGTAIVVLAMAVTALVVRVHISALIFGAGLGAYMLGATVLMVLGAERLLLVVLAPGVLGSTAFLILGRPPQLEHAAWGALAATPLLALVLAVARASRAAGLPGSGRGRHARARLAAGKLFVAAELRGALPSAGFGLVAAGLLVFPVAAGLPGHGGANTGALLASLPLALSMGAAEWMLIWFRRRTQRLLHTTREVQAFAIRARLVLFAALLQYLTAAVLLTAAVIAVAAASRLVNPHWTALPQIAAYMALGGSMFIALLLQAFGSRAFPLIACTAALAFEVAGRGLGVYGQIVACTELLVVLAGYAALVLGRAVRHAC